MKEKENLCALIEALIFMSDKPITLKKICSYIGDEIDIGQVQEVIAELQQEYQSKRHGISLMEIAGGFQFRTKQDYSEYLKKFCRTTSLVLSPTAMEVLAVIAYRGPIAKSDIDKIRGVDSSYIVRNLMEKGLVRISGKSAGPGRSSCYQTTQRFLEMFNLTDISDLPLEHELEEMAKEGVGEISDIKTLSHAGDSFYSDELEELDRLGEEIKKISADTDFTKALKMGRQKKEAGAFRSAFEILAEHIGKKDAVMMNTQAVESQQVSLSGLVDEMASEKNDEELPEQDDSNLEAEEARLEQLTGKMVDDARKLDLNLDFIGKEESAEKIDIS